MEKPLHDRMLRTPSTDHAIDLKSLVGAKSIRYVDIASAIADEIEREYVTKEQHEAEIEAIVEAQKGLDGSTYSAEYVIKTWADHHGIPMKDGECITRWLDRWFIKRPMFEDMEPVQFRDELQNGERVGTITYHMHGACRINEDIVGTRTYEVKSGEFVKRPTPKVLDSDGVEIKVGEKIYNPQGYIFEVRSIEGGEDEWLVWCGETKCGIKVCYKADECTHERPVLDANGERIRKGDTVWNAETGEEFEVIGFSFQNRNQIIRVKDCEGLEDDFYPSSITHREPDSIIKVCNMLSQYARADLSYSAGQLRNAVSNAVDRLTALIERGA